ncbi:Na+/H+ antiporter NhaA [Nitrosovibrio sp. Nv4]|uniref:Na+/H+ antiporter NhaA n=1 Tax=Nitrosovibrio sp. Nv4 TaxID=1945880 RepID=UPI000BE33894|nr:Na+/H+ antiporter NhaA [Nitrosovibrio sp. Nv4]
MTPETPPNRLDRPVDEKHDHVLGPPDAEITLVEYGSYADASSRAAHERVAELRNRFGNRLRYVFRHRPLKGSDLARRAAELVESYSSDPTRFWNVHVALMTRSDKLSDDDLRKLAADLSLGSDNGGPRGNDSAAQAKARVDADIDSATASGVIMTPTFFINDRRYDGPWDVNSLSEAMLGSLGHVVHSAALDFAKWAPSTGIMLLVATGLAVVLSNSIIGPDFRELWNLRLGFTFAGAEFGLSLQNWINDGLLVIFFLVVGLEIKREFTIGHLANPQSAMLPVAAAIGGMAVPAILYLILVPGGPDGTWPLGWGVPMATDTAFAIALIAMMGRRVPIELRVFLTAAAIVDDIGAIIVVAIFYTADLHIEYLASAVLIVGLLALLNEGGVYRASPYVVLGIALWTCVHASGIHATLAGVILALFIPTRPPPNLRALMLQADAILTAETQRGKEVLRYGPSEPALEALDAIHDRLESPADRMLRHVAPRSSFLVLPVFALANAGVVMDTSLFSNHAPLMASTAAALVIGKPLGFIAAAAMAVWLNIANKPYAYSWRQLAGAGALAGIGFTMSLFIASQTFPVESDYAAVKIAIFTGSILSAMIGVAILWNAGSMERRYHPSSNSIG